MKKLFKLTLCVIVALALSIALFNINVNAATYDYDSFTDGSGYGTKTEISENVTNLKGETVPAGGMYVGPFSKASTDKLAEGISEEAYIEVDMDKIATGEFFEVSLALRNANDEYVTETVVMSQKLNENEVVVTAGWAPEFEVVLDRTGIYTYQWNMFVENDTPYANFTILSGDTVLGTTGNVDMDTIQGPDDKNPILEQEDVSVKYLWFCNVNLAEGINVYATLPGTTIDVIQDEEALIVAENPEEALTSSLESNGIVVNPADTVEITVKVAELAEEENSEMVAAVNEKVEGASLVGLYDITLPVTINGEAAGELSELAKPITLKLAIPEGLPEVAEGLERVYYVVRNHNGEVEVLNTTVNEDNTISFETDAFSTYALAYVDQEPTAEEPVVDGEKDETPKTGIIANVEIAVAVVLVAAVALVVVNKNKNK